MIAENNRGRETATPCRSPAENAGPLSPCQGRPVMLLRANHLLALLAAYGAAPFPSGISSCAVFPSPPFPWYRPPFWPG